MGSGLRLSFISELNMIFLPMHYFSERFGIHWVNFTHPDRPRIPKKSATELKKIFADNGFPGEATTVPPVETTTPPPVETTTPTPGGASAVAVNLFTFTFALVGLLYVVLL